MDLWLNSGSQFIIFISNNFTSSSLPKKRVCCLSSWAVSLPVQLSPGLPKVTYWCCLECLWPPLTWFSLPSGPPREPSYLSGLEPGGPPWLSLLSLAFFCYCTCNPASLTWLPWEPSNLGGLEPGSPPLSCLWLLVTQPSLPFRLPWEPSYLS
jgi:hypothetical protein